MIGRIKIRVVADFHGQLHHNIGLPIQHALTQFLILAQRRRFGRKKLLQKLANFAPRRSPERKKFIQPIARHSCRGLGRQIFEQSAAFQRGKIDNVLAQRDADSSRLVPRLENAERQILQRKMRVFCDLDERTKSHAYDLTTKITKDTKSYFYSKFTSSWRLKKCQGAQIFARFIKTTAPE